MSESFAKLASLANLVVNLPCEFNAKRQFVCSEFKPLNLVRIYTQQIQASEFSTNSQHKLYSTKSSKTREFLSLSLSLSLSLVAFSRTRVLKANSNSNLNLNPNSNLNPSLILSLNSNSNLNSSSNLKHNFTQDLKRDFAYPNFIVPL